MQLGLSVSDIKEAVAAQNIDLPAGNLETRDSDILIRFSEERKTLQELENLIVISSENSGFYTFHESSRITLDGRMFCKQYLVGETGLFNLD